MKKVILILILFYNIVFANNYERKLYEQVIPSIFVAIPVTIYADDDTKNILKNSDLFNIVNKCDSTVDLIVGKNFKNLPQSCQDKPIFATSYRWYKKKNSFGAFYWRKGRPQLKLKKAVIEKFTLTIPENLRKYLK